ncbi:MAG: hypothetical protein OEU76_10045, partial [Cyclobacteriaceae bacterium]|nr:hypothetical protein [Cyclobacteriaceae bacterium]
VRGGERIKKITQTFLDRSGLQPTEIAREILTRAGKGELYIVLPKIARKMWMLKRLMPTRFRKMVKEKYFAAVRRIK